MTGETERRKAGTAKLNAEFFLDFADKRIFGRFAWLDLAAWKLPETSHRLAFRALCKQHALVVVDQCHRRDENQRLHA